ncbi:MAG: sulfatase-like hydrolase/transferase, partial [bacterium]|nr:sulfatase-like hydrolase/transferase [bacterium]
MQEKDGGNNAKLDVAKKDYNVLLITIDTIRFDRLSIYSDRYVKTPNIDELARQSYLFTRAFAHNPVTLPSHTNILTGTTPRYHGISDNTGFKLEDKFLTISEYLKEKGYATGAFLGAFPLDSRFGLNQGFDVYDDNYGTHNSLELFFVERPAEKVIAPAVEWLSARESKWFAWVHLFDPHQPYSPPPPYDKEYSEDLYSGEVAYMDAALGKLFAFLKNSKFAENTVVIITGDHGEALYEKGEETHSYFAYNNTIHIPLIIHIPGTEPKTVAENVCHSDIFPTICDILGKEIPEHLQGETLLPIVAGNKRKNNTIYFESLTPFLNRGWAPLRGFIRENLKFIHLPIPEVYDIHTDLDENKNLAGKKEGQLFKLKRDLVMLKKKLTGKQMMQRSRKIDADSRSKLKSLGYLSGSTSQKKDVFTKEFDLKTMLPQQNRMQDAMNKYQKGMVEVPVAELKKILEKSPSFILVYKHIATILRESGRLNQAIEIL